MKMLTLTQPWATLIAIGAKRIETRGWKTDYRGPIAIHAAKGLNGLFPNATDGDLAVLCSREPFASVLADKPEVTAFGETEPSFITGKPCRPVDLPRGAIICVADLVDVLRFGFQPLPSRWRAAPHETSFGDFTTGRYGWLLENVRPLPVPYEIRGERSLVELDARVARYIAKEIEEVPA